MTQQPIESSDISNFLVLSPQDPYENFRLLTNRLWETFDQSEGSLNIIWKTCFFDISGVAQICKILDATGTKLNSFVLSRENYLLEFCLLFSDKVFASENFSIFPFLSCSKHKKELLSLFRTTLGDWDNMVLKNNLALLDIGNISVQLNLFRNLISEAKKRGRLNDKLSEYLLPSKLVFFDEEQTLLVSDLEGMGITHVKKIIPSQCSTLSQYIADVNSFKTGTIDGKSHHYDCKKFAFFTE